MAAERRGWRFRGRGEALPPLAWDLGRLLGCGWGAVSRGGVAVIGCGVAGRTCRLVGWLVIFFLVLGGRQSESEDWEVAGPRVGELRWY